MSLLTDLQDWYKDASYPPREEIDNFVTEIDGDTARWGTWVEYIYERDGEYVAVLDCAPATEMQDWGDYGEPEIYPVEPYEVTVTQYRRLTT